VEQIVREVANDAYMNGLYGDGNVPAEWVVNRLDTISGKEFR
jgi:hypothetical protein